MRKEFIESIENVKFDEKSHAFKWITPRKISFLPSRGGGGGIDTEILFMNSSKEENRRDLEGERDTYIYLSRLTGVSMLF